MNCRYVRSNRNLYWHKSFHRCGKWEVSTLEWIEKASIQVTISSTRLLAFLGVDVNSKRPSNSNCSSGSLSTMFEDNSSLGSTNFPETIWPTSFAGIGENSGQTTKGWCRTGAGLEGRILFIARPAWDATAEAVIAWKLYERWIRGRKRTNKCTKCPKLKWTIILASQPSFGTTEGSLNCLYKLLTNYNPVMYSFLLLKNKLSFFALFDRF